MQSYDTLISVLDEGKDGLSRTVKSGYLRQL